MDPFESAGEGLGPEERPAAGGSGQPADLARGLLRVAAIPANR